jgi:hypothetical protein
MSRHPNKRHRRPRDENDNTESDSEELKKWSDTFGEAIQILGRVVSYPSTYITTPEEERSILLQLCHQIADVAEHPEESPQYKDLAHRLEDAEIQISELSAQCDQLTSDVHRLSTKSYSPDGVKSGMNEKLDRLQSLLADQIAEQRKVLDQSKSRRSHSRPQSPLFGRGNAMALLSPSYREEVKNLSRADSADKPKPKEAVIRDRLQELPFSKKPSTKTRKTTKKN